MQNALVKVPIVLSSDQYLTFKVKFNFKVKIYSIFTCPHHNHPFKLGLTNLDQKCKIPWLRSLLFCGAINRGLQGQIWLKKSNFQVLPLLEIHNNHITTRGPWVPRLLHGPDCFMVSILSMTYIPRLFHGTSCFKVSTRCAYIDLGSWGYFGVKRHWYSTKIIAPWF